MSIKLVSFSFLKQEKRTYYSKFKFESSIIIIYKFILRVNFDKIIIYPFIIYLITDQNLIIFYTKQTNYCVYQNFL